MITPAEKLNVYAPRHRYKCPYCAKRFKAIPQRTEHSPYPVCPRCGVPVSEEHQVRAFDRTRKVLRVLCWPALLPVKLVILSALGVKASTLGVVHAAVFLLMLPVALVKAIKQKRFADAATLEKYMAEVKGQWKGDKPISTGAKVVLSSLARLKLKDSPLNPHGLLGTIIEARSDSTGRAIRAVIWGNGSRGTYYLEELQIMSKS
jgi:DNA-directed RNA polymerase subunit RPC12/RpoP